MSWHGVLYYDFQYSINQSSLLLLSQRELFPVKYPQQFYAMLVQDRFYTLLAFSECAMQVCWTSLCHSSSLSLLIFPLLRFSLICWQLVGVATVELRSLNSVKGMAPQVSPTTTLISRHLPQVGAYLMTFVHSPSSQWKWLWSWSRQTLMCSSIPMGSEMKGISQSYRRKGLGTELLRVCLFAFWSSSSTKKWFLGSDADLPGRRGLYLKYSLPLPPSSNAIYPPGFRGCVHAFDAGPKWTYSLCTSRRTMVRTHIHHHLVPSSSSSFFPRNTKKNG